MLSGYALHAQGAELDAIAAVVIGGTLLAGGYGYVAGALSGVLVLGAIQTLIAFDGTQCVVDQNRHWRLAACLLPGSAGAGGPQNSDTSIFGIIMNAQLESISVKHR